MDILLYGTIGIIAGYVAGIIGKEYGFGVVGEMGVGLVAAFVGGFLFDYSGLNAYGLWGTGTMAFAVAAVALLLTKTYHPAKELS